MTPSREDLLKKEKLLKELAWAKKYRALDFYAPYEKQMLFHNASVDCTERYFMAANRGGKSFSGSRELAMHLTGRYPDWWTGRRFTRPIQAWAANKTGGDTRDVAQENLLGVWSDISSRGSGAIPKECIDWKEDVTMSKFVNDGVDNVMVQHETNGRPDGKSKLSFKSYDQGREKWQGKAIDVIWLDEEPPDDIYFESLARLVPIKKGEKAGLIYITATPLLAKSKIRDMFRNEPMPFRQFFSMTLFEVGHVDKDELQATIDRTPEWLRRARIYGLPLLGEGPVFSVGEDAIRCVPFTVPPYWARLWGIDFGIFHPFAAVLLAWDKDADCLYVTNTVRMKDSLPIMHAAAMLPLGKDVPVAWPQDGTQRKEFEGVLMPTAEIYRKHGLKMQHGHAKFPDGSISTEAGILEMSERMASGRFKVFSNLTQWFEEFRDYHRLDGHINKINDDLMSATRIAVMARRGARAAVIGVDRFGRHVLPETKVCAGAEGDHFGC